MLTYVFSYLSLSGFLGLNMPFAFLPNLPQAQTCRVPVVMCSRDFPLNVSRENWLRLCGMLVKATGGLTQCGMQNRHCDVLTFLDILRKSWKKYSRGQY